MGDQQWVETAAQLRNGFESAFDSLGDDRAASRKTPPPFIQEGYWADYDSLKESFPDEWKRLDKPKQKFFERLWQIRLFDTSSTNRWFRKQTWKLLGILNAPPRARVLYVLLFFVARFLLRVCSIFLPKTVATVFGDVRLYLEPHGEIEKAIVQRIDKRVGEDFLRMIGLDWNFTKLPSKKKIRIDGKPFEFERIVWVAHSLGSVISYNVLSDLFARSDEFECTGTAQQKRGVIKFRRALRRFVTLGSPLDKIATLFPRNVLRPWKPAQYSNGFGKRWWVNFYHVLDPVSGALNHPEICKRVEPHNYHMSIGHGPGVAHTGYWKDPMVLEYILSRTYGKDMLELMVDDNWTPGTLTVLATLGYLIWFALILGVLLGVMWPIAKFVVEPIL
jgi:hypothetical protein